MRRFFKRLGKAGAAIVILLLVAEVACRFKMYYRTRDTKYLTGFGRTTAAVKKPEPATPPRPANIQEYGEDQGHRYYKMAPSAPGTVGTNRGETDGYRINSLGFRGPEFSRDMKPGMTRIFCVGDSNTIGLEVKEDLTWPAALARALERHSPARFEVINAGFTGYTSWNYLMLISHELIKYSPDVFVVYGGVNDLNQQVSLQPKKGWAASAHDFFYNRSIFYTLAIEKISVLKSGSPVPVVAYQKWDDEEFAHNTTEIIGLARQHHVRLVFVRELLDEDVADADLTSRMNQEMSVLQQLTVKHQVEYLDLRPAFLGARQAGKRLFRDAMHLDADGYALLAAKVAEIVQPAR